MITPGFGAHTSASFAFTARCRLVNRPGMLAQLTAAIGSVGGDLRGLDIVRVDRGSIVRDVTVLASGEAHASQLIEAMRGVEGVELLSYSDRTFLAHLGGKIQVSARTPIRTRDDLSMVYTPGVARISTAIARDPERARTLTIKRNCVAIVTDGSAVLGLGNIGPLAALPVMEGKAMLFKEFGNVDAFPICLDTQDVDAIVTAVAAIAPTFGGINLEDISGPRCFEVEARLAERLDIPVFHDDQHGTAVVVLAALLNALRVVSKPLQEARIVCLGIGAAGTAVTRLLLAAGATDVIGVDREGILCSGDPGLGEAHAAYASATNPRRVRGGLADAMRGADVFIGTSVSGALSPAMVEGMADLPVVFALANPEPEVPPEAIEGRAAVVATGRSDYPNQINNVLCFPGFFRGLLDSGARQITDGMKLAAARAIAGAVGDDLHPEYIVPSVFNRAVAGAVAAAVEGEARRAGLSREPAETIDPLHNADVPPLV
ncbi:MAG: malic enzyme-like NAD(P)-binding protein [Candidatus Dormibacteria bacterium]